MGAIRLFRYIGKHNLGGFDGNGRWTHLLLFGGRLPEAAWRHENSQNSAIFVCNFWVNFTRKKTLNESLDFRKKLFNEHMDDPNYVPLPEERERPGGFNWGGEGLNAQQPNQRPDQQEPQPPPQQPAPNQ